MADGPLRLDEPGALVDYAKSLDCIHCGLCLQTCPTFRLTGVETSSPRGRIHLMRAVAEGRADADAGYAEELDFCLLCRHCESVCPAGVRFGEMMEHARGAREAAVPRGPLARLARWFGFRVLLPHRPLLRLAAFGLRLLQVLRLDRLLAKTGLALFRGLPDLPRVRPLSERSLLPRRPRTTDARREEVLVLEGCVQAELFAHVNRATVSSLERLGVACSVPEFTCCGSLHAHNGDPEGARRLAERLLDACGNDERPLVVNSAGCGAHLRELSNLFPSEDPRHARAEALERRVVDYAEFVAPRLPEGPLPLDQPGPLTWDDPCHLCHGQGIRQPPRDVLGRFEGPSVLPLENPEACCGSAGIYSVLRPEDSQRVFAPKLAAFQKSGARTLVTQNPGCQIQWDSGLRRAGVEAEVVHLAELVDRALS